MPLKTQKILRWIPIVNFILPSFWIISCFHHVFKYSDFFKAIFKMFGLILVIAVPYVLILDHIKNPTFAEITSYFIFYVFGIIMASVAISEQKKMLDSNNDK